MDPTTDMLKTTTALTTILTAALWGAALAGDATSTSSCIVDTESRGWRIAQQHMILDGHVDVPYRLQDDYEDITIGTQRGDFDFPRAVCGGLNVPFMSIYIPPEKAEQGKGKELADELIDEVHSWAEKAPDKFTLVDGVADVEEAFRQGKIALPMGMENGSGIEQDLDNLRHFYDRGIRYITLAHSKSNAIADSSYDDNRPNDGLTDFGREMVREMNRIGIMVDVSHITDEAFYDVMEVTRVPVVATHSSARHFTPGFDRNMSDEMIERLAENGGVIQINFGSSFLTEEANGWYDGLRDAREAYLEEHDYAEDSEEAEAFSEQYREDNPFPYADRNAVLDHIDHVVGLVGVEHVGLGSDYDGVGDSLPSGLKDVSDFPNLVDGLIGRGYDEDEIAKILSGNVLRVWRQAEDYAASH